MKATVIAIILLCMIVVGAAANGVAMRRATDSLLDTLDGIPGDIEALEKAEEAALRQKAEELAQKWNGIFPYLTYTVGYTALNRADEAVLGLCSYIASGAYSDAAYAHRMLCDALRRIRENEVLSLSSVF